MSFAVIAYIVSSFLAFICLILLVADEPEFLGWDALAWGLASLFPAWLGHWIPGSTHGVVGGGR